MDLRVDEHPKKDRLEMYLLGTLNQHEAEQLEEHLVVCRVCIQNARKLEDYIKAMQKSLGTGSSKTKAARKGRPS